MQQRADFLVERGLAEPCGQRVIPTRNLVATLCDREVTQVAKTIATETGLQHRRAARGRHLPAQRHAGQRALCRAR